MTDDRLGRMRAALGAMLTAERDRWILWLPVALGIGVLVYFALPVEPPLWYGAAGLSAFLALAVLTRRHMAGFLAALLLAALCAGFLAANLRTLSVEGPILTEEVGPGEVIGRVAEVQLRDNGHRLVLDHPSIEDVAPDATPERIRITVRKGAEAIRPGDWVRLWAVVSPPYEPVAPGAFDFARKAFFEGLGGMGFAMGAPRLLDPPASASGESAGTGLALGLVALRHSLATRLRAAVPGDAGALAAALLIGDRSAISPETLAAMRNSGIAHLLAISGLHVGLVAGFLFVVIRMLLALIEPLALRYPIKKWAALLTLLGTLGYLFISGASIPTQRAFIMTALLLIAVLIDRTRISMRLIAWAAIAVLIAAPESLLGPSFQMSFAAAMALIATYERAGGPLARWQSAGGAWRRPALYVVGVLLTTLVAGLATGPFAAFHFNRIADYSLVTNLAAVPITAFWIMPWGMLAFLLLPFGAEQLALVPMGWGIDAVVALARGVAGWPGSVTLVPAMPLGALVLVVAGGLWLCLWRRRWRLVGLAAIAAGLILTLRPDLPDVLVDGRAKLFAVRTAEGELALSSRRSARFAGEIWLRRAGLAEPVPWPADGASGDARLVCDSLGCLYRAEGRIIALVRDPRALAEDCALADVVIALVPVEAGCAQPATVIDRFDIWREGAHAVWLDAGQTRVTSVAERRGVRPWTVQRGAPWE
jgi:competence protein ComEC